MLYGGLHSGGLSFFSHFSPLSNSRSSKLRGGAGGGEENRTVSTLFGSLRHLKTHTTKPAIWLFVFLLTPGSGSISVGKNEAFLLFFCFGSLLHFGWQGNQRVLLALTAGSQPPSSFSLPTGGHTLPSSVVRAGHPGALRVRVPGSRPGRETCDGHTDIQARERGPWTGKIALRIRRPLSPADILCQNGNQRPRSPGARPRVALLTRGPSACDLNGSPAPSMFGALQSRRQAVLAPLSASLATHVKRRRQTGWRDARGMSGDAAKPLSVRVPGGPSVLLP